MQKHTSKSIFHRKPKGRLLSMVLLIAMLLTQAASAASSENLPNSMQGLEKSRDMDMVAAKNGIVRVVAGVEGDDGKKTSASGFIIGMDDSNIRVITVLHAVDLGEDTKIQIVVKNDTVVDATLDTSVMSKEKDFCLLSAENMFNDKNMLSLRVPAYDSEEERLASGDEVTALGFSAGLGSSSGFTASDVTAAAGKLSKTAGENAGFLETGIAPFDGADGGPLVDKDGYVVGLMNSKIKGAEGVISAIDISSVEALLDSGDYAFRTKDKDLMYNELFTLCADGEKEFKRAGGSSRDAIQKAWKNAVDVMAGASYSRTSLSTALNEYKGAVDSAHKKVPTILPVMTALLGAVILGLAIRLILLIRWDRTHSGKVAAKDKKEKKKSSRAQKRRKAPQRVETAMPAALLQRVLRSPVTGAEYMIGGEAITLGRNDSCDIQLPSRKVSQRHACIRNAGGRYLLFDMGSTNGTYINDVPVGGDGTALTPGDIIRLADVELQFIQR